MSTILVPSRQKVWETYVQEDLSNETEIGMDFLSKLKGFEGANSSDFPISTAGIQCRRVFRPFRKNFKDIVGIYRKNE